MAETAAVAVIVAVAPMPDVVAVVVVIAAVIVAPVAWQAAAEPVARSALAAAPAAASWVALELAAPSAVAIVPGALSGIAVALAAVVLALVVACGFAADLAALSLAAAVHCFAGVPVGVPACSTGREIAGDPDSGVGYVVAAIPGRRFVVLLVQLAAACEIRFALPHANRCAMPSAVLVDWYRLANCASDCVVVTDRLGASPAGDRGAG